MIGTGFNGAGLIQPGGRVDVDITGGDEKASMGPGLFSPEDSPVYLSRVMGMPSFNGAGLIQPGGRKRRRLRARTSRASMGPGLFSPEDSVVWKSLL